MENYTGLRTALEWAVELDVPGPTEAWEAWSGWGTELITVREFTKRYNQQWLRGRVVD